MKKRLFILIIAAVLIAFLLMPAAVHAADAAGEWVLSSAKDTEAEDYTSPAGEFDYNFQCTLDFIYTRGAYKIDKQAQWNAGDTYYSQSITESAVFTDLPERIMPNETVTVKVLLSSSAVMDTNDTSGETVDLDPAYARINFSASVENTDSSEYTYEIPNTYGQTYEQTESVTFSLPAGGPDNIIWVEFGIQGPPSLAASDTMSTKYYYSWVPAVQQTQPAEPVFIGISGVISGPDNNQLRPLPRIKTDVYVWYDISKIPADWNSGTPDLTESAAADLSGVFSFKIPVPEKRGTVIGIIIKVTMRCVLPQNKDVFFLADYQDANAKNEICVSTLISVDLSDEQYKNADQIKISRAVQFHNIPLGFLTFDDKNEPEAMQTNLADTYKFLGYSYMYRLLWDALTVGGVVFDELPSLLPAAAAGALRVDCNYIWKTQGDLDCSHYSSSINAIRLTQKDCLFDDNSRFTVLHEFGHFFEGATNKIKGEARCGWQTKMSAGDINHGGYLNKDTADSFVEGFATWYACVCQIYRKDFNPYQTGSWNIKDPATWKAWDLGGINEELSVASVFANAMYMYDDIKTFWQNILRPDRGNFYEYYNAMTADFGADAKKIAKLNNTIAEAGLFRMPFGNNQYDIGEPFRDTDKDGQWTASAEPYTDVNGNGRYDTADPFADSDGDGRFDSADEPFTDANGDGQYDFGEAYTDTDGDGRYDFAEIYTDKNSDGIWNSDEPYTDTNNDSKYDTGEIYGDLMFAVGASGSIDKGKALQVFDMKNAVLGESAANNFPVRKSTYLQPNSFITLTGESTGTLKVTIRPDGQEAYAYTAYPADSKIYIGLSNTPSHGTVEIAVPGGETIYEGDIAALQVQLNRTIGQISALDYAEIKISDLAPAGTVAAPSGGDPDASGVFNPNEISNSDAEAMAASFDPDADITSMTGLSISGTGGTDSFIEKYSTLLISIAALFILIIIIIAVRRRSASRKKQQIYYAQPVQPVYHPSVYRKTFCRNCGTKIKDGTHFCENCGQKID